jgi:NitT/TauT family transport system substrate-binding protein
VNLAASKEDTFALADSMISANSIAKGVKVKSVLVVVQNGGSAIVSWADNPVKTPKDLVGKSIGAAADQKTTLDLFLSINRVRKEDVTVRVVAVSARNTIFYQKQVDAIVSTLIGSPMDMIVAAREGSGPPVHLMPFSDYGITAMSIGACVHQDTIAEKPDLVRRFSAASLRPLRELSKEELADEATDIAMKLSRAPAKRRESVKLQWISTLPRLQTPHSKGKPLGWTSEEDWKNIVDLLVKTESISSPVPVQGLYTNDFITG